MMPCDSYVLYQAERSKSALETRYVDRQVGEFAAAACALLRGIRRPAQVMRAAKR